MVSVCGGYRFKCGKPSWCEHITSCSECIDEYDDEEQIQARFWYGQCLRCVFEGKEVMQWQYDDASERKRMQETFREIGELDAEEKCAYTYNQITKAMKLKDKSWKQSLWLIESYIGGVHSYYSNTNVEENVCETIKDLKDAIRKGEYRLSIFVDGKKYSITIEQ